MADNVDHVSHVVDSLVRRLGGQREVRQRVAAAVASLNLNRTRATALATHLDTIPDVLTSARSDGPQTWVRLSQILAADFPDDVVPAKCVRCGRSGILRRRLDGQRGCGNCYRLGLVKPCVRCGQDGNPVRREKVCCGTSPAHANREWSAALDDRLREADQRVRALGTSTGDVLLGVISGSACPTAGLGVSPDRARRISVHGLERTRDGVRTQLRRRNRAALSWRIAFFWAKSRNGASLMARMPSSINPG